ncbi:MAG TPA: PAS domain-containing protein, partial [Terriglobales bacterium]|nr:PAS domain-containing protein [Terriglobales bacterium]
MSDPDARRLTSQASGTVMARRFLPGVFFLPIFLGWICLRGQTSGMYGIELGLALYAAASTIVLVAVIWWGARQMNKEYDQRSRVEVGIRELNTELEGRLEERTKTLGQRAAVLTEQAALLDLAQDAIVVRDMHSRILFWNLGAEAMFGWTSLEVLGTNTNALLKTEFSEAPEAIEATLLQQGRWRGEAVHRKRDGTRLIVASRWALQRDA